MDSLCKKDTTQLKYIFVAGAPGSKWSSVVKNIYFSADIDQTDYSEARTYYHDASGTMDLMHLGAYYDPGMEFGGFFDRLQDYTKAECEAEFDRAFLGTIDCGVRIIKSHVFAHQIDFLKQHWPECPVILVHRGDDACLGWWVKCGHFTITYPSYHAYYKNIKEMTRIISAQNRDIEQHMTASSTYPIDNYELCNLLNIQLPPAEYQQNYSDSDIKVSVL
jgi:hypothetical protein